MQASDETKGKFSEHVEDVAEMTGYAADTVWRAISGYRNNEKIKEANDWYREVKRCARFEGKRLFSRPGQAFNQQEGN